MSKKHEENQKQNEDVKEVSILDLLNSEQTLEEIHEVITYLMQVINMFINKHKQQNTPPQDEGAGGANT